MNNPNAHTLPTKISEGVLLVDKPEGKTSFSLVTALRKLTRIETIGHAGTLDPFATGLMIMLIGKNFTRLSQTYLCQDKEYVCKLHLGITTNSYDCDGKTTATSPLIPTLADIEKALLSFQGPVMQTPPMFSAKKIEGKKLYELARKGIEIERKPALVTLKTTLLDYAYPYLSLNVSCSKGTYVRSIAHDLGNLLGCGAHLCQLRRIRSGNFHIKDSINGIHLYDNR
ncbi:MAG TPA: tRNA pseudouridine(55) synthase TruB [Rhabdochlamydiaceae bacterium]|nr:tRNA pseudouridine(55) synthase TruB [Rhabdochlamydiaceae bacterium]